MHGNVKEYDHPRQYRSPTKSEDFLYKIARYPIKLQQIRLWGVGARRDK